MAHVIEHQYLAFVTNFIRFRLTESLWQTAHHLLGLIDQSAVIHRAGVEARIADEL
jgi:hypothetical protein